MPGEAFTDVLTESSFPNVPEPPVSSVKQGRNAYDPEERCQKRGVRRLGAPSIKAEFEYNTHKSSTSRSKLLG